jgi:hypothetical protein
VPAFVGPISDALFGLPSFCFPHSCSLFLPKPTKSSTSGTVRYVSNNCSITHTLLLDIVLSPTFSARHHLQSRAIRLGIRPTGRLEGAFRPEVGRQTLKTSGFLGLESSFWARCDWDQDTFYHPHPAARHCSITHACTKAASHSPRQAHR